MKLLTTIILIAACTFSNAQTELPYSTSFTTEDDKADWKTFRLGETTKDIYVWDFFGDRINHNYPVGGEKTTDDWIVSSGFYLGSDIKVDSLQFKGAGFGTPFGIDTIALYVLNGDRDPAIASKELVYLFTDSTYSSDNVFKTIKDIEINNNTGVSYFAFRYKTIINWLDVSIDNIAISGKLSSVMKPENSTLNIYPNPADKELFIDLADGLVAVSCNIYNTLGSLVLNTSNCQSAIDVEALEAGIYTVLVNVNSTTLVKRINIK
jgi:hypothetical protein